MSEIEFSANVNSRREFLKKSAAISALFFSNNFFTRASNNSDSNKRVDENTPWYRKLTRWGQTNINEIDPLNYDIDWWREYWKQTRTQVVIINVGGIVSYYPSEVP